MVSRKDALTGRFFIFVSSIFIACANLSLAKAEQCNTSDFDDRVIIKQVIDGDTVITAAGEHVRLIGINTPEIKHDGSPSEAGAVIAKQRLHQLINQQPAGLRYGEEKRDKYGRVLAHLFSTSGDNLQAKLLSKGLAMPLNIPPNVALANCYASASLSARNNKLGLWALRQYQPVPVQHLTNKSRGFRIIQGKVISVSKSRSSTWINLENNVAIRLVNEDLPFFTELDINQLVNTTIEARGWLYRRNKQLRMRLRHPLDIAIIQPE